MKIEVVTIFPEMIRQMSSWGVVGRAVADGIVEVNPVDLRDFTEDVHKTVDGRPFGGGPGMVMRVDVLDRAIQNVKGRRVVLLSPQGEVFSQKKANELARLDHLVLISGRYEGVDERVREHLVDEEVSIGDYVLSGGEIPAMVVVDAVARLVPGVVGKKESLIYESFSSGTQLDYPQYTHPAEYKGWGVPEVLRSGDHAKIKTWRENQSQLKTLKRKTA